MENALLNSPGGTWDQDIQPETQLDEMTHMLSGIAHKCLMITPGNHEQRTVRLSGIDPAKVISERLEIPYFSGPAILSILAGGYKWSIYVFHGKGGAITKGGKLNAAGRARTFTGFINFYLSGHVHDPIANPETCIIEDPVNCRLVFPQQWTVIASSFLGWEDTYAYRWGYPPPGRGSVSLELFSNGDYRASLR